MSAKKIKIALVAPYPAQFVLDEKKIKPAYRNRLGHPASWVRSLTTSLAKRDDVEIKVFTHSRAVSSVQEGEENGVRYIVIPKYEPARIGSYHLHWPARIQFRKQIKVYAPDIVHGFGTESAYGMIAVEQDVPGIVFVQGIIDELWPFLDRFSMVQKKLLRGLERRVVKNATGLIAETGFAKRWAESMNPAVEVVEIPHIVNPEFYGVVPDYSSNECLCIGTIHRIKAVDTAIRAMARVKDESLRLSVIGYGPQLKEMKSLSKSLGVADRVEFCGHMSREQIMGKMSTARMLTILSRMDTSPNVLSEAHAAGLPVIGTRTGGIPDMIDDGQDGFLVDVDDAKAVAKKMDLLSGNLNLCREMGESGREKVSWLNDSDRIAGEHVKFYHEILGC